jgi:hypothetical protein
VLSVPPSLAPTVPVNGFPLTYAEVVALMLPPTTKRVDDKTVVVITGVKQSKSIRIGIRCKEAIG